MQKIYKVFISSTFKDLESARQQVSEALLKVNCFPLGMETFPAADVEQFEYIKDVIDECDYYVLISAGRYGSIHPDTGLSYTEMEYDYAVSRGVPIIRLLHSDPFNALLGSLVDSDENSRKKLIQFRDKMSDARLVRYWKDYNELALNVVVSLLAVQQRTPGAGWVRASEIQSSELKLSPSAPVSLTDWDAIKNLPVPLLKVAITGEVLHSTNEARAVLNHEITNGTQISELLKGLGRPLTDWLAECLDEEWGSTPQFLQSACNTKESFFQVSLNPVSDTTTPHVIVILNDVTDFKNLQLQFVQSQDRQAIVQLAGGVAHDFNNLLTAISGHCDLMLMRHDQGDVDYTDLVQIHQNANRGAALVGQLLAYSRQQNLQLEILNLRDTLSNSTHLLNRLVGERITLTLDHEAGLSSIRADKRQLEQVLMNLVVNARDAMPDGGSIRIVTENTVLTEGLTRDGTTVPAGKYVVLRVHDTGTGIAEDKRTKIFEPFWTSKKPGEGTGLGLSTVFGIIKQSGGYIFVDSTTGVGTTFSVLIPRYEGALNVADPSPLANPIVAGVTGDEVVLLVEKEASVRSFASRALRLIGFKVFEADCIETAVKVISDNDLKVGVVMLDNVYFLEKRGQKLKGLFRKHRDIKIVLVANNLANHDSVNLDKIPNSVQLRKPYSLNKIQSVFKALND